MSARVCGNARSGHYQETPMANFHHFFYLLDFILLPLLLLLFPFISLFIMLFFKLLMRNADVWDPKRRLMFVGKHIFIIGNAFRKKGVRCAHTAAAFAEEEKNSASKFIKNVHSDSFEWRDVEILSPSVRDRYLFAIYFIFAFLRLGVAFFFQLAKTKEPYHRCRSVAHFFMFAFNAFVDKCTLTHIQCVTNGNCTLHIHFFL